MHTRTLWLAVPVAVLLILPGVRAGAAEKYGGVLRSILRQNPSNLSIHETTASNVTATMTPVYGNLVWYDPYLPKDGPETIRPELAASWQWSSSHRELVFKLRQGLTWHDGQPVTGRDVKSTFDVVRGAVRAGLKLNPRRRWYVNVTEIATNGDHEVTFKLTRPQPSLLSMLAGGNSPVYPAHVDFAELRTRAVGTGPFKLKSFRRDQMVELEKNPQFYLKGRPFLDGVQFIVMKSGAAELGALIGRQADTGSMSTTPGPVYEQLKAADVGLAFKETIYAGAVTILMNTRKPPFDNARLRKAVALAADRAGLIKSVFQGAAVKSSAMLPQPWGSWGLDVEQLSRLPGYGEPEKNKAEARRMLAEEGYGPGNPLRVILDANVSPSYTRPATWLLGELKAVGIEADLRPVEQNNWFAKAARRDFTLGIHITGVAIDDPDANFYENYGCGSERNYTDYCNPELVKQVDAQSAELDIGKRKRIVNEIDIQLQQEGARPYLANQFDYYAHQAFVKNWIPHHVQFNGWRLTEVWLDK
ncbi:MAG: ABC transporter substrate-binding protein [Candidatus Lambdaproteobacteria bacterium]|nr:ABC transporter substrate-binding protein [Candidatus Lambdaproteobacteria bacterium]